LSSQWHLGTNEYHPTNHGFDYYYGAHMTQNECVSSIRSPGAALVAGVNNDLNVTNGQGHKYGACPIFNGSTDKPWKQRDMLATPPRVYDMNDVDEEYDAAAAEFIRNATEKKRKWFFYFASHHTHVPQFGGVAETGYTLRGLQGDSLALLDRSVGRIVALLEELAISNETLVIFSADNGGARYWGPDVGGVNGELACGKATTWEGGVRVPTMLRWPGVVAAGSVNQELISSLDWFPTIAKVRSSFLLFARF
jgi:arylsulfatase A